MRFSCGGEAAFTMLAAEQFDVVVTDMRMPRTDGAAVLNHVKTVQPQAVRIVLSGQTAPEAAMKAVFLAHRFLSKPCDPAALQNAIERACLLQALLDSPKLRREIGKVTSLPAMPVTFQRLTSALNQPMSSMKDIAAIVERDVALTAKILQLVNSAFFGLPRKVGNIADAVSYLGVVIIKSLALAMEAFADDSSPGASETLQKHSLLTAQLARGFFPKNDPRAEQAFLAGLLHDIGRLVTIPGTDLDGLSGEQISHGHVGAYLLSLWGLPQVITEAVAHHHDPTQIKHSGFDIVDAVYLADHLASCELTGPPGKPLDLDYLNAHGVPAGQLDSWSATAHQIAADGQHATV